MLKEAINPIEKMVSRHESRGTLSRDRINEITEYIGQEIRRWKLNLDDTPAPNGSDYLAFHRPIKKADRNRLLESGSGISQADFHSIMLQINLRKAYLNNFLQSNEVRKRPSPKNILSRLVSHKIALVATPTTHILTLADNPQSVMIVKIGLNFINIDNQIVYDTMETTDINRLHQKLVFVDQDFVNGPMGLTPNLIDPLEITEQLRLGKNPMLASNFPKGRFLYFTDQAQEVIQAIPLSEIVLPTTCLNGYSEGMAAPTVIKASSFVWNELKSQGWSV